MNNNITTHAQNMGVMRNSWNTQAAPDSRSTNQFPVNGMSLGNNVAAFPANWEIAHNESGRHQPQALGVHYQSSGTQPRMSDSGTSATDTTESYWNVNRQQNKTIESNHQYEAWQPIPGGHGYVHPIPGANHNLAHRNGQAIPGANHNLALRNAQPIPDANHNLAGAQPIPGANHNLARVQPIPGANHNLAGVQPIPGANHNLAGVQPIPGANHNLAREQPIPGANHNLARAQPIPGANHNLARTQPIPGANHNLARAQPIPVANHNLPHGNTQQIQSTHTCPQVSQATDEQLYGSTPHQMYGMSAGPRAVQVNQNTMDGGATRGIDTIQDESLVPQQLYNNQTAEVLIQQYGHYPHHELHIPAEGYAMSQRFSQSFGNRTFSQNVGNTSDNGHMTEPGTIAANAHTAPPQQCKKETTKVTPRRPTKLARVPRPQSQLPEPGIEFDAASNPKERNGMQEEQMAGHDQNDNHMAEKDEDERENTDVCPTCKKTFDDHDMQIHLHECKKSGSRRQANFKCTYCKQQFHKEYVYDRHLITKHPDEISVKEMIQQKIPCVDCDETFQSEALKRHHRVTAHKIKEQKNETFKCDICDMEVMYRSSLTRHMDLHDPEKRYKCQYCGGKFQHISSLGSHHMYCKKAPKELQAKKETLKQRPKAKKLFKCEEPGCNKKPYETERSFQ